MQKPLTKNSSGFESQESVFYIYFKQPLYCHALAIVLYNTYLEFPWNFQYFEAYEYGLWKHGNRFIIFHSPSSSLSWNL